jgi:hypothetical protein
VEQAQKKRSRFLINIFLINRKGPTMEEFKILALANYLEEDADSIQVSSYDENLFEIGTREFLVVTDEEADELWEADLQNYLDECIYPELPKSMRFYFDDEAWKRDARYDGRGHSLNRYDGNEDEITIETEEGDYTFYIYRQN